MQKYEENAIICNKCGRKIAMHGEVPVEDVFRAQKVWGYFSEKDGVRHSWNMCEQCYGEMIGTFAVPPVESEETEMM